MQEQLIKCHFTQKELIYFRDVIACEKVLTNYVGEKIKGLDALGVKLLSLETPNVIGKLLSYIRRGAL